MKPSEFSGIWMLSSGDEKRYLTLVGWGGEDPDYWGKYFTGQPMSPDWELPRLEILWKTKKLGDFVGWQLTAPVISERAKDVLAPLVKDHVQFLRFHDLRDKPYYVMNVLTVLEDAIIDGSPTSHYTFKPDLGPLPPIFKITSNVSPVFVTEPFAEALVNNKLTGACLQNPGQDSLKAIVRGEPLNDYPGLL